MSYNKNTKLKSPTSPHLSIYKWQITFVLSIMHRMSGIFLFFGIGFTILLFVVNVYYDYDGFLIKYFRLNEKVCYYLLFFWLLLLVITLLYHAVNGARFILLDITAKIDKKIIISSGYITIAVFSILSIAFICALL